MLPRATLKKHEFQRYDVWYEYYKLRKELVPAVKNDISWVGEHWKTILAYIHDTYTPPKSAVLIPVGILSNRLGMSNFFTSIV